MDQNNTDNKLRTTAEQSVVEENGVFRVNMGGSVPGVDESKKYTNRDEAIDVAFKALQSQSQKRA